MVDELEVVVVVVDGGLVVVVVVGGGGPVDTMRSTELPAAPRSRPGIGGR